MKTRLEIIEEQDRQREEENKRQAQILNYFFNKAQEIEMLKEENKKLKNIIYYYFDTFQTQLPKKEKEYITKIIKGE